MARLKSGLIIASLATLLAAPAGYAHDVGSESENDAHHKTEARAEAKAQQRDARKQKVCERHERNIERKANNLVAQAERQLATFDNIADRVKEFKTNKNLTVADYDALVASLAVKRATVNTQIVNLKADIAGFDCDDNDAKATMQTFKSHLKDVRAALKDYRTAVRTLLTAVKTANGTTEATQ